MCRLFRSKSNTEREQWASIKAAAFSTGNQSMISVVEEAEQHGESTIISVHGRKAMIFPTDALLDELCSIALSAVPRTTEYFARASVRTAFDEIGFPSR